MPGRRGADAIRVGLRRAARLTTREVRCLPKVELHLHLEGSIRRALARHLLAEARVPRRSPFASRMAELYRFRDFKGFLRAYAQICSCLTSAEALQRVVRDLGCHLRREGVLHAEIFFSPSVHARNGLPYEDVVGALERGAEAVETAGGPSLRFIADGVRQWGAAVFSEMVASLKRRPSHRVVAVGLGGDEKALPARRFARGFDRARQAGLSAVVHAGEGVSADGVAQAVDWLRPERIAHGIGATGDASVMRRLRRTGTVLDVCITSNLKTAAVSGLHAHPLPRLLEEGIRVTLGTDDPALFRVTLSGEYVKAHRLGVTRTALGRLALEAAHASILPAAARRKLEGRLQRAWRVFGR
ncbi:MAG: adenosine deaminase [Acidobacteriota bacterium]